MWRWYRFTHFDVGFSEWLIRVPFTEWWIAIWKEDSTNEITVDLFGG